jgi:hypothetical protein
MDMAASVSPKLGPFSFERGEAALRCRRTGIEKLGNGCDKLRWRERFGQKNAVGDTICGPFVGTCCGHVDDGEGRVDLSGVSRYFPSVHLASPEINVRYECAVFALACLQQGHRLFSGWCDCWLKTSSCKSGFNNAMNHRVIINHQDDG